MKKIVLICQCKACTKRGWPASIWWEDGEWVIQVSENITIAAGHNLTKVREFARQWTRSAEIIK